MWNIKYITHISLIRLQTNTIFIVVYLKIVLSLMGLTLGLLFVRYMSLNYSSQVGSVACEHSTMKEPSYQTLLRAPRGLGPALAGCT